MEVDDYDNNLLKVIAVAEAFGELDPPKPIVKYWVHPINHDREELNQFDTFYTNLRLYSDKFFEYYRMSKTSFDELLEKLRPYITKENTQFRNSISAEQQLTITLR
ncbi:DDE Tnp4 domain-containing protein, partial [Aphis craccivora]